MFKKLCRFKLCLFLCLLTGCAGPLGNGRSWGRDTSLTRVKHISSAAGQALRDPRTWLPAAGALALNLSGWDKKVSGWAGAKTPVFGSNEQAQDASLAFGTAAELGFVSTALLTPNGRYVGEITSSIGAMAGGKTERPSAGSASAFSYAALGRRNAEALDLDPKTHTFLDFAFATATAGSAWGEVEAKTNSPSNALVGAALNNFFVKFLYKSFLGDPQEKHFGIAVDAQHKGVSMEFSMPF